MVNTPNGMVYATVIITLSFIAISFIMYTGLLSRLQKILTKIFTLVGGRSYEIERQLIRTKNLKSKSLVAKYYKWAHSILVNQGLLSKGITVTGFTLYSTLIALVTTILINMVYGLNPLLFMICFGLVTIVLMLFNTLRSASYLERREALIMDTLDLVVPQVNRGVKNAIIGLIPSIHPLLRLDFQTFINNLGDKMYFDDAMILLQTSLGSSFESFAQKAIRIEHHEEDGMLEIFSDVLEDNQHIRILRNENNEIFAELRTQLIMSLIIIMVFTYWLIGMEPFVQDFLLYSSFGKLIVLLNIGLIVYAFGFITMIKAAEFD